MQDQDYINLWVEETPDALIATGLDGRVLYWSKGAEATFGYSVQEAAGRLLDELVVPPDRMEEQQAIRKDALENGSAIYESVRRRKDGSLIYINTAMHAVRNEQDRMEWLVNNKRDITKQKALRDSKLIDARYRDLLESIPDAIVIVNDTRNIVLINSQTETLFGYMRAELLGQSIDTLVPLLFQEKHPEHRAKYFADPKVRPVGAGLELFGRRKDGKEFPVEISLSPLKTEEGMFVSSSFRDITERKLFERSLQNANRMKSEFLAGMSHELRTPLNGILGFTEFLVDEKPGPLNEKQKEYLMDVYRSAQHLLQLINDVLDLAKVEAGRIDLYPESFELGKAVEEVCSVVKGIANKRRIDVNSTVPAEFGSVTLDQQKFKQVCYNLLANGVKFTESGGKVGIGAARLDGGRFELWVTDTGIGIKEEDMARLFLEFEQLDQGAGRRYEGTGLGLALTRKLVEFQGGSIRVRSAPGVGSTFTVNMPVVIREVPVHE